jgi:plastocyanin
MSKIPALTAIRIIPRDTDFLDRRIGSIGEIFLDRSTNSLRVYDGGSQGGSSIAKSDLTNVSNASFLAKATAAGVGGAGSTNASNLTSGTVPIGRLGSSGTPSSTTYLRGDNTWATIPSGGSASDSFSTIAVAGQSNVVADSSTDTLTLVAGANITITTNASTDTITIAASTSGGSASDSFSTIAVAGQSNVVADSSTDTLTLVAGTGISITTNASTDSITITNSQLSFNQSTDAVLSSTTIDKIYLPAITMLAVTNSGASAYRFDQYGTSNNPTIYAINGTTIAFNLQAEGHPFLIQNGAGVNYNTGLIHVATNGTVSTGASAQGKDSGTLYWKIPTDISGGYRYQCSIHAPMVGSITIKAFSTL